MAAEASPQHPLARRFVEALHRLERDDDSEPIVGLFGADAELRRLAHGHEQHGTDGAEAFWREYRSAFDHIDSRFTGVVVGEDRVALEWAASGALPNGHPIDYRGVSVLDLGESEVRGFRAYYDSAAFLSSETDGAPTGGTATGGTSGDATGSGSGGATGSSSGEEAGGGSETTGSGPDAAAGEPTGTTAGRGDGPGLTDTFADYG